MTSHKKSDSLLDVSLSAIEKSAFFLLYHLFDKTNLFLSKDFGVSTKLKELTLKGRFWALEKRTEPSENGSYLSRWYEQVRGRGPKNTVLPEGPKEVPSMTDIVEPARENQLHEQPVADSKGAEDIAVTDSMPGSDKLKESLEQYAILCSKEDSDKTEDNASSSKSSKSLTDGSASLKVVE